MIPTTEVSGATLDALIVYVSILGILLLAATWLRLKIPFLRQYHIPASLLAGVLGLLLGPYFIGLIPAHIMDCWSALSGRLIVFVFAPMLMGRQISNGKTLAKQTAASVCWSWGATCVQYAVPILLCAAFLGAVLG